MNQDSSALFLMYTFAVVLSFVITYYLIKSAVRSANRKQTDFLDAQTRILIEMARKQGVSEDEISKIQKRLN